MMSRLAGEWIAWITLSLELMAGEIQRRDVGTETSLFYGGA